MNQKIILSTALLVSYPILAHAYVDPGFSGSMYQVIYLLIFVAMLCWILKPYRWIQKIILKLRNKSSKK